MQTTLLGLAIAIILALVSALVAPLVIDWNRYRSAFEQEASRLTGLTVHVRGSIDARILPTPRLKLHDVEVGEPGRAPQLQASFVELEVGLGPLLRGRVQATELRLVAPQISVGLDSSGAIDWPAFSPSLRADALTVSRLNISDGRITLTDAASGSRVVLEKLSFNGDIGSFAGPFSGEGGFAVGAEPCSYRISGSRVDEHDRLKLRLGVDPSNHPLTTDFDGTLGFDGGVPQFDGTLALARPVGVTLANGERVMSDPWQLTGKVRATPASASLKNLALQYGPDERAVNFTADAELAFGAHPHVEGAIAASAVDVDRMLAAPDVTHRPPFVLLTSFIEDFVAAIKPPVPVTANIAIDAVTVGSATIQSLRGKIGFDAGRWNLDHVTFHAPGLTDVNVSGELDGGAHDLSFSGPASLESADLKTLMAWLEGRADQLSGPTKTLTARGRITIASDRLALDQLSAALDQEKVEGRLAYTWATGSHPAVLDGELHAAKLDVDALVAFARASASDNAFQIPHKVSLVLDVGKATLAGVDAQMVNARVKFDAGVIHIDRLSIGDLGGAALDVSGRIDELSSQPRGRLTFDVDATTLAGLTDVAGKFIPQIASPLRPFIDRVAPAKVHGILTVDRAPTAGTVAKLDFGGELGALRVALNGDATGDPAHPDAAVVHLASRFDADDGGALVRLLDLDHVLAVDQLPGRMTISANGPLNGDIQLSGLASAGGFSAAAQGTLHLSGKQGPSGSLQLKVSAADLRPLQSALTGQPGAAVLVTASAIIGVAGTDLSFTDLAMTVGKSSLRGRFDLKLASPIGIGGDIVADDVDATAAAAMLLGLPSAAPGSGKPWSSVTIGGGLFAALNGDVNVKLDRAALTSSLVARDLKGVVHFHPPQIALRDIDGSLAGGHFSGDLAFRRDSEGFIGQGHVELADAKVASFVANKEAVGGLLTVKLHGESTGSSPDAVVGSLHGGGRIALVNGSFGGLDPVAFAAAVRTADQAADQSGSIEAAKIAAAVSAAMEKGRLAVPQAGAEVTITGGQIHLANATLQAQDAAKLSLQGVLDLRNEAIDAQMTLSDKPPAHAMLRTRPELTVTLKGPLAAPARRIDVSALVGWLTLRATEQQTRRLESIEANRRADVLGPAIRLASPSIRFIPQGTALETRNQISAWAGSTPAARGFDRLRPEGPVLPPPTSLIDHGAGAAVPLPMPAPRRPAPGAEKTTAAAGTAATAPRSAPRSPLDFLFRSQN